MPRADIDQLARISVALPVGYDSDFGVNVQKSSVLVPPVFAEVIEARAPDGTTFEDFRREAIQAYRSANSKSVSIGCYPDSGLKREILARLKEMYKSPSDAQ